MRHDAFTDFTVTHEQPDQPGEFVFPLPFLGNESPARTAVRLLVSVALKLGLFVLLLRLVAMAYPELAGLIAKALIIGLAAALAIKWFSSDEALVQWPIWVGAGLALFHCSFQLLPDRIGQLTAPPNGNAQVVVPYALEALLAAAMLLAYIAPYLKSFIHSSDRETMLLFLAAAVAGGGLATSLYVPESDFGAWVLFASLLSYCWPITALIGDQYIRFAWAMNPALACRSRKLSPTNWIETHILISPWITFFKAPIAVWTGNLCFVASIDKPHGTLYGLYVVGLCLCYLTFWTALLRLPRGNPFQASWNALCFWLTYNRQRVFNNPNVFQCRGIFREPSARLGVVGVGMTLTTLALFHMLGMHVHPGANKARVCESNFIVVGTLPQQYPSFLRDELTTTEPKAVELYELHAAKVKTDGDSDLRSPLQISSLKGLVIRVILSLVGGPLLFLLLLIANEGNNIVAETTCWEEVKGKSTAASCKA